MWRFVSAARMAQIKADARAEGYIKAVREGLAALDAAKEAKQGQQIREPHVHTSDKAVQEIKQAADKATQRKIVVSYRSRNVRLIEDGVALEAYIFKCIGKMSNRAIAQSISKKMGTHVQGKHRPMIVDQPFVSRVINRRINYDSQLGYFVRDDKH